MTGEHDSTTLRLNVSWKIVSILLLIVIVAMVAIWRPWQNTATSRSITITGEATVSSEPDQLVFYPYFEVASTEELTSKANDITAKLKELGVEEKHIKTNANSYDKYYPVPATDSAGSTLSLQFTVTITNNKELSQKVQDYLVSQNPKGQITPQATFSDEKRRQLQDEASGKATADARTRAEKMASELGGKVGKVKTISEASGVGVYPVTMEARDMTASNSGSLPISVGENEFTYQIQVEFELK